jgi:hypothetical protein
MTRATLPAPSVVGMGRPRKVAYSKGMPTGLPGRVLCFVAIAAGAAHAQDPDKRRQVAVIDLSGAEAAKRLRTELYNALLNNWALKPTSNQYDSALQGELISEEDRDLRVQARKLEQEAEEALAQFDARLAKQRAIEGLDTLLAAQPSSDPTLRGDLAFALGIAELTARDTKAAELAFALAARLDPMRRPDPARYMGAIVRAFDAAKSAPAKVVTLEVKGTGHVWIDGVVVGVAPGTFETAAGLHVVQLADSNRLTRGQRVVAPDIAVIADDDAPMRVQIERARAALARAPDAIARAGRINRLAELIDVRDVVLIATADDGSLRTQTVMWKDGALAYSDWRAVDPKTPAEALLEPLSGPKPEVRVDPPPVKPVKPLKEPHRENEPAWYRRRWVQVSVAGAVIATVVGIYLLAHQPHYVTPPMKGSF